MAVRRNCTARDVQALSVLCDCAFVPALVAQLNSSFACSVGPKECVAAPPKSVSWCSHLPLVKAPFSVIISTPVTPGRPDSTVDCAHLVSALPYTSQYTPEKEGANKTHGSVV